MLIRLMQENDLDIIVDLEHDLFTSPWTKQDFIYELNENPFSFNYVLEIEEKIVGYIGVWISYEQAQITTIGIHRDFQRNGYGNALLEYARNEAIKKGASVMSLEVRVSNNKAISLYEKNGFKKVAIRKNYYEDNHEDAHLMVKELEV